MAQRQQWGVGGPTQDNGQPSKGIYNSFAGFFNDLFGGPSTQAASGSSILANAPNHSRDPGGVGPLSPSSRQQQQRYQGYPGSSPRGSANGAGTSGSAIDSFYGFFNNVFSKDDPTSVPAQGNGAMRPSNVGMTQNHTPQSNNHSNGTPADRSVGNSRSGGPYVGDSDDLLDQHVAYNLRHDLEAQRCIRVTRKGPASYDMNGRDVQVEWHYSETPGGPGHLVAVDGGQRQPFSEYIKRPDVLQARGGQGPPQGLEPSYATRLPYKDVMGGSTVEAWAAAAESSAAYGQPPQQSRSQDRAYVSSSERARSVAPAQSCAEPSTGSRNMGAASQPPPQARGFGYPVDKEDLLDQHVAYFLKHHPEIYKRIPVTRRRPGLYDIAGREVQVEWQYSSKPGRPGQLVAIDGPLRQPFSDYMTRSDENVEYNNTGISQALLHQIPAERRLTFGDQQNVYSRLDAMKVAKAQAQFREKAADYVNQGQEVPPELMAKYEKILSQKLGTNKKGQRPPAAPGGAAAPASAAVGGSAVAAPPQQCGARPSGVNGRCASPAPSRPNYAMGLHQPRSWSPPPVQAWGMPPLVQGGGMPQAQQPLGSLGGMVLMPQQHPAYGQSLEVAMAQRGLSGQMAGPSPWGPPANPVGSWPMAPQMHPYYH